MKSGRRFVVLCHTMLFSYLCRKLKRVMKAQKEMVPFLKWAGGKRWLAKEHSNLFPDSYETYIEPFVGSGAVFFSLQSKKSIINDKNSLLIKTYKSIKRDWRRVVELLEMHQANHSKDYYYEIRGKGESDDFKSAARFIYLNRTCWNGLYRVNRNGQFNVPIGTKSNVILDSDDFQEIAKKLKNTKIENSDFEKIIENAKEGDFLFIDPPYTVKHNNNGFVKYNENIFSWKDQVRLKESVETAIKNRAKVIVTNANHESILDLYDGIGEIITVSRKSVISGKAEARGAVEEVIIKCF